MSGWRQARAIAVLPGEDYRAYKRNVPRWLPRHTPWVPPRPCQMRTPDQS